MVAERYGYGVPYGRDRAGEIYTDAMSRMYGLVALGIVVTAGAIWVGDAIGVGGFIFGFGWIGALLALGAIFGTLIAASAAARRGALGLATALYLAFAVFEGLFLSPILTAFTGEQIGMAFVLTAGMFGAMSVVGMRTKRDISKLGPILMIGLVGVIVVSLINVFILRSSAVFLLVNIILLPLFLALTVWETKQMKELAQQAAMAGDDKAAAQAAVIGGIGLYLNAVNIFIIVLNLLGFASGDD